MKTMYCNHCGALVFFESVLCVQCGYTLGFLPDLMDLAALEAEVAPYWKALAPSRRGSRYRACANGRDYAVCNWWIPESDPESFCVACRLNAVVPDISRPENVALWHKLELAKRRLVYTLRQLGLSIEGYPAKFWPRLQFRFLADIPGEPPVLTGHNDGVITVNLAEADDAERERRRSQFHESQRTLVGHLRHESGHYYWDALVAKSGWLDRFRSLFGDERIDYASALQAHYTAGPASDWESRCVSAYASAHPWEDWAETWANYLLMVDSLETAAGFRMVLGSRAAADFPGASVDPGKVPLGVGSFEGILKQWLALTCALNALNRGAGLPDLYPVVLSPRAVEKLQFVHEIVSQPDGKYRPERRKVVRTNSTPILQETT